MEQLLQQCCAFCFLLPQIMVVTAHNIIYKGKIYFKISVLPKWQLYAGIIHLIFIVGIKAYELPLIRPPSTGL